MFRREAAHNRKFPESQTVQNRKFQNSKIVNRKFQNRKFENRKTQNRNRGESQTPRIAKVMQLWTLYCCSQCLNIGVRTDTYCKVLTLHFPTHFVAAGLHIPIRKGLTSSLFDVLRDCDIKFR